MVLRPIQLPTPVAPVKSDVPSSVSARRFTSATRTCSMTCWASLPPGTWSMLITFAFGEAARTTSAIRNMTCVLRHTTGQHDAVCVGVDLNRLVRKQPVQLLLE